MTAALNAALDTEITAAFKLKGLDWFLRVMPGEWCAPMEARVRGQILRFFEATKHPNTPLKHLKIVPSTESSTLPH